MSKIRLRKATKLANETPQEKENRLARERIRAAKRREAKKGKK